MPKDRDTVARPNDTDLPQTSKDQCKKNTRNVFVPFKSRAKTIGSFHRVEKAATHPELRISQARIHTYGPSNTERANQANLGLQASAQD